MNERLIAGLAILAIAASLAGCNKPNTAYNNSGASATPGSVNTTTLPATTASPTIDTTATITTPATAAAAAPAAADAATTTPVK